MGQHKHNPTALAAARGELPPKPPKKTKSQCDAELRRAVLAAMVSHLPGSAAAATAVTEDAAIPGVLPINRYA